MSNIDVVDKLNKIIQLEYSSSEDDLDPCINVHVFEEAVKEIVLLREMVRDVYSTELLQ